MGIDRRKDGWDRKRVEIGVGLEGESVDRQEWKGRVSVDRQEWKERGKWG